MAMASLLLFTKERNMVQKPPMFSSPNSKTLGMSRMETAHLSASYLGFCSAPVLLNTNILTSKSKK
jgi:hypothetical protein